jgi:hypothetical protein
MSHVSSYIDTTARLDLGRLRAVRELGCVAQPEVMGEMIAGRIIAAAGFSERDPARLRTAALAGREND